MRVWAEAHPERDWITGRGWYYEPFTGGLPTRQMLDALVPDRPAYLTAYDGHTGWANTRGAEAGRHHPPHAESGQRNHREGSAHRRADRRAEGSARWSLMRAARCRSRRAKTSWPRFAPAIGEAHRCGVTSVQNAGGSPDDLELYDELRKRGELTVRVYQALVGGCRRSPTPSSIGSTQLRTRFADDPLFKTGAIKLMADGVIESHTAAMLEPYTNRPATNGRRRTSRPSSSTRLVGDARSPRLAGDDPRDRRRRGPDGARRLRSGARRPIPCRSAAAGIASSTSRPSTRQTSRASARSASSRRCSRCTACPAQPATRSGARTSVRSAPRAAGCTAASRGRGGRLAFGSDWPVVTHRSAARSARGRQPHHARRASPRAAGCPAERLPLRKAIDAYTRNAAWASFDEHRKGTLERDMLADIVDPLRRHLRLPPRPPHRRRGRGDDFRRQGRLSPRRSRHDDALAATPGTMESYARGPDSPLLDLTLGDLLAATAARVPHALALVSRHQHQRFTYQQLLTAVDRVAGGLLDLGLVAGDRVGVWSSNCTEWILLQLAAARAGLVLVNVNPAYRSHELGYVLRKSGMKALFLWPEDSRANYRQILEEARTGNDAALRHAIFFDERTVAAASAPASPRPIGRPRSTRRREHSVHVGHDRIAEGRVADASQPRQQRRVLCRRASSTRKRIASVCRCRCITASVA